MKTWFKATEAMECYQGATPGQKSIGEMTTFKDQEIKDLSEKHANDLIKAFPENFCKGEGELKRRERVKADEVEAKKKAEKEAKEKIEKELKEEKEKTGKSDGTKVPGKDGVK